MKKSPSPCDTSSVFFGPANQKHLPCPNFHQQMRGPHVDNVLPMPDVMPLPPLSDVPVNDNSGHVPSRKDHGATLSRNRTAHVQPHLPRLWNAPPHRAAADNKCRFTVTCEPAGGLYPSASKTFFSAQESRPHEKQPQASWYGPRRARTTRWGTATLHQCTIVIGSSLFPMSRGRFAFTREAPNALVGSHSTCVRAEQHLPLVLLVPNLVHILSEMECRLEFVQNDGVSTQCLCQRGDVRICRQ